MILGVIIAIAIVVAFLAGIVFGYGIRVHEEETAYKDECIRAALKRWHGHTTHKGYTILSPDIKEGGIR